MAICHFSALNPWSTRGATVNLVSKQFRLHCSGATVAAADTFEVLRIENIYVTENTTEVGFKDQFQTE